MSSRTLCAFVTILVCSCGVGLAPLEAQSPARLLLDLETQVGNPSCSQLLGSGSAVNNGVALFAVRPDGGGCQLWRSDGSVAGTQPVRELESFLGAYLPRQMTFSNGRAFFNAGAEGLGDELWCSDGSTSGTRLLGDLRTRELGSRPGPFVPFGNGVLFQASDDPHGSELWFSDGTPSGTRLVADLVPGPAGSMPGFCAVIGGVAVFPTFDGRVWRTDGTASGTYELGAALGMSSTFGVDRFVSFAGRVWFTGRTAASGSELWASDGTVAGTTLVYDIASGTTPSDPRELRVIGNLLYFSAGSVGNAAAYVTNGVQRTPTILRDLALPASVHVDPSAFTGAGGRVFFSAERGDIGRELWTTDGTAAGTRLVADLRAGRRGSEPRILGNVAGKLLFHADDGVSGAEFWTSDGTAPGTTMLLDLGPGNASSTSGFALELSPTTVLLSARPSTGSDQLWRTDGTSTGTQELKRFCRTTPSSYPTQVTSELSTKGFFTAYVGGQHEVWTTDGTSAGSSVILPGAGITSVRDSAVIGTRRIFASFETASGAEPWISDGTALGTQRLIDLAPGSTSSTPSDFESLGNEVLFAAYDGTRGRELWISDGTAAGTRLLADLVPGAASANPSALVRSGSLVFFIAGQPATPEIASLWRSDGTPSGTFPVTGVSGGAQPSFGYRSLPLFATPDAIYFASDVRAANAGLWRSDGTVAGTGQISSVAPMTVAYGTMSKTFVWWRDALWFVGLESTSGQELWSSDGSAAGTQVAFELAPGNADYRPRVLGVLGDRLYFSADDGVHGRELWSTDGTVSGTSMLRDIAVGVEAGVPAYAWFLALPGAQHALFLATDGAHGLELWRTDGSASGTRLHQDLRPGPLPHLHSRYALEAPVLVGSSLVLAADDDLHGLELFAMESMAASVPFGSGCAGAQRPVPRLESRGTPKLGNSNHALEVCDGAPFAPAQILVAPEGGFEPLGNHCALWLDPTRTFLAFERVLDSRGTVRVPVPIPADPSLAGAAAFAQAVARDPLAPMPSLALSAGLRVLIAID